MAAHPLFAAVYDRAMASTERAGLGTRRGRLLAAATGRVLEVGGGTGANLAHYRDASSVTVLEPDRAMAQRLRRRVPEARVPVEVAEQAIEDATLEPASFDTVVVTLVLCTVRDPRAVLDRIRTLLSPGGRLLLLEHVGARGVRGRVQHLASPAWSRLAGGCHPDRDTLAAVRDAGFLVTDLERFSMPKANPLVRPCIQAVARPVEAAVR